MTKYKALTDDGLLELLDSIARPTFKYLMRRIDSLIIMNEDYKNMEVETFIAILLAAMAPVNANLIKWIANFHFMKTNKGIDVDRLMRGLVDQTKTQLGIKEH